MKKITFYALPAPAQRVKGEKRFMSTLRTNMHKASLTALTAGLEDRLNEERIHADVSIVDMQTLDDTEERYGELNLGGLILEKYRVGYAFESVSKMIKDDDVIGINANFTNSRAIIKSFMGYARCMNKNAIIIVGGTDASLEPNYYLKEGANVVVRGEGEQTLALLLKVINKKRDMRSVPNISFNNDGSFIHNPDYPLLKRVDINRLPPPNLDSVDLSKYTDTGEGKPPDGVSGPFISLETSRGCANSCSFCSTPSVKGKYRFMSVSKIASHLSYLKNKGIKTLLFQEDNILSRAHRKSDGSFLYKNGREDILEIFRLTKEMGFSWEFANGLEFGLYEHKGEYDHKLMEAMFWNRTNNGVIEGCYRVTIPLENLSDEGSKYFRKLKTFDRSKEIIKEIASTGVRMLSFGLIIGRPEDTESTLRTYYEKCVELKELTHGTNGGVIPYFNIYVLSLLPGTADYKRYNSLLSFDIGKDPEVITFYLGSLKTPYFSPLEITQARGTMTRALNNESLIQDFDDNHTITSRRFERLFS